MLVGRWRRRALSRRSTDVADVTDSKAPEEEVRAQVERQVRRRVGMKVLRDMGRWADGVERERQQRPRVVLGLLALVIVISVGVALLVL